MKTILIEPTDVLFFRDAIPMSAGQGTGAGCRMPFPSTVHEALRASLLRASGELRSSKEEEARPPNAARKGDWHARGHDGKTFIATRAFRSLQMAGPLPWHADHGLLVPVPLDAAFGSGRGKLHRLQLWRDGSVPRQQEWKQPSVYHSLCLPVAVTPPDKHGQVEGWWTVDQMRRYLEGETVNSGERFVPFSTAVLWETEHRIGVEIEPGNFAAKSGQLYAGSYLRPSARTRFAVQIELGDPRAEANGEGKAIAVLDWLLLGGEFRLARLWHKNEDCFSHLKRPPAAPPGDGPCLLKWVLVTPAIFAHGSLPGWCADSLQNRAGGPWAPGRVCLELPGRAQLASWCIGKPRTVSGWDVVDGRAKPTLLAVPAGGGYYFLCENRTTATELACKLHWQPRADFYGDKGCGYGLVSFDVQMHPTSRDVRSLADEVFNY